MNLCNWILYTVICGPHATYSDLCHNEKHIYSNCETTFDCVFHGRALKNILHLYDKSTNKHVQSHIIPQQYVLVTPVTITSSQAIQSTAHNITYLTGCESAIHPLNNINTPYVTVV